MSSNANPIRPGMWRVPAWLAVVVVVASLGGGIAGAWWWLQRDTQDVDAIAVDAPQKGGKLRVRGEQPEGIVKGKTAMLQARAGGLELRYKVDEGGLKVHPIVAGRGITPEQEQLRRFIRQLLQSPNLAKQVKLTNEQRKDLRQLNLKPALDIADEDRARLETLAKAYQQAGVGNAQVAAEKALVDAMKEVGLKRAATTQATAASVQQVQAILTPEQLRQCQEMAGKVGRKAPAGTTRPTTRPVGASGRG